jgi:phosphoribosylaminoimidazolecarboxamide formyltransferase/IMP cyclohydrolase
MIHIKRALLSVSDKTNLVQIATFLTKKGVELISTGGTLKELQKNSIPAIAIDDFTGYPEMLEGRVKTLHPKVHAGLLADPDRPAQKKDIEDNHILYLI